MPDGELSLAIGKEGLNARLAHRLTGWRIDIVSETEYYAEETDTPYTGAEGEEDEFPGRCVAVTSSGKRCPNQALDGSRYCGVPAHRELAAQEEGAAASPRPVRQCAGCGSPPSAARAGAADDGRDGELVIDRERRLGGRGVYLCPDAPMRRPGPPAGRIGQAAARRVTVPGRSGRQVAG